MSLSNANGKVVTAVTVSVAVTTVTAVIVFAGSRSGRTSAGVVAVLPTVASMICSGPLVALGTVHTALSQNTRPGVMLTPIDWLLEAVAGLIAAVLAPLTGYLILTSSVCFSPLFEEARVDERLFKPLHSPPTHHHYYGLTTLPLDSTTMPLSTMLAVLLTLLT